jgi:ubiquinone/menaquinone biosynthesis C-methylase UbiE
MEKRFDRYSRENIHFFNVELPLLESSIRISEAKRLIDLGCGDGAVLFMLEKKGLLEGLDVYGCDLSQERLNRLAKCLPSVIPILGNASNLKQFRNEYFDFAICSQVIEHVEDDGALLREVGRLLRQGGTLYISSVVKKWYGWWIYRNNGRVVCDPTHVREYPSAEHFIDLLIENGFKPLKIEINRFKPSLINAMSRILCKHSLLAKENIDEAYAFYPLFNRIARLFSIPVPGYFVIEVVARKER